MVFKSYNNPDPFDILIEHTNFLIHHTAHQFRPPLGIYQLLDICTNIVLFHCIYSACVWDDIFIKLIIKFNLMNQYGKCVVNMPISDRLIASFRSSTMHFPN